jgi:23S rRNA pseudouridine955/2504/2580 synthase
LTLAHPVTGESLTLTAELPPACRKILKQLESV